MSPKVAICMATYNGERYLREQIDSILNQTYSNWVLFIRDDGSTDKTIEIIQEYTVKNKEKIIFVPYNVTDLGFGKGAAYNFMACLKYASSFEDFSYFMFSDQDDVWLPNKIKMTLGCARRVEKKHPEPVLVHTDMKIVDSNLKLIDESIFHHIRTSPDNRHLNQLLIQCITPGCSMLINRRLVNIISFNCKNIVMHDWWISQIACCFGTIVCLRRPTILYRQHTNNVYGAKRINFFSLNYILNRIKRKSSFHERLLDATRQANILLNEYQTSLDQKQIRLIYRFANIKKHTKLIRLMILIKNQYYLCGTICVLSEFLFI